MILVGGSQVFVATVPRVATFFRNTSHPKQSTWVILALPQANSRKLPQWAFQRGPLGSFHVSLGEGTHIYPQNLSGMAHVSKKIFTGLGVAQKTLLFLQPPTKHEQNQKQPKLGKNNEGNQFGLCDPSNFLCELLSLRSCKKWLF